MEKPNKQDSVVSAEVIRVETSASMQLSARVTPEIKERR